MFLYALSSWLVAQIVMPVLIMIAGLVINGWFLAPEIGLLLIAMFVSLFITIPGLIISWLFLGIVIYADYTPLVKFLFWLIATALAVVLNALMIVLLFNLNIDFWENVSVFVVVGVTSIWVSCFIRMKSFFELNRVQNIVIN